MGFIEKLIAKAKEMTSKNVEVETTKMSTADYTHTMRNTPELRKALKAEAKAQGLQLPEKVGEKFGHPVTVYVVRNATRPKGAKFAVNWVLANRVFDTWIYDDAVDIIKELNKAGVDVGEYDGIMYRGQGNIWRLRVKM